MNKLPPFPSLPNWVALQEAAKTVFAVVRPPAWVEAEVKHRMVLLLNHILMAEPEATKRPAQHKGQVVRFESIQLGQIFDIEFLITPAGLLSLSNDSQAADLTMKLNELEFDETMRCLAHGQKPKISIEGDIQLAAQVNWLVDHVRWDIEADLARMIGDEAAHWLGQGCKKLSQALKETVSRFSGARS